MKRGELERHLRKHGCQVLREGGEHTMYINPAYGLTTAVPRHNEIKTNTAYGICNSLSVPRPPGR